MPLNTEFIIIWGMHRSGTSMLARSLRVFGADLGANIFAADRGNVKGYFEDRTLIKLNTAMLSELGLSWDSLAPVGARHVQILEKRGYAAAALEFLRSKAENTACVGLKDPRMTRLAPFWRKIFDAAQISPKSIIAIRHPLAVAHSLQKRAQSWKIPGFTANLEYGCYLWLGYTLAALLYTAGLPRALVEYENFLAAPDKLLAAIAGKLDLKIDPAELQLFQSEFVDHSLDHNSVEANKGATTIPRRVTRLYTQLRDAKNLECPPEEIIGEMWPSGESGLFLASMLARAGLNIEANTAKLHEFQDRIKRLSTELHSLSKSPRKEK